MPRPAGSGLPDSGSAAPVMPASTTSLAGGSRRMISASISAHTSAMTPRSRVTRQSGAAHARPSRLANRRPASGKARFCRCSRTDSSTRPDTSGAVAPRAARTSATAAASGGGRAGRRRVRGGQVRGGHAEQPVGRAPQPARRGRQQPDGPVHVRRANAASTWPPNDGTVTSPRATANASPRPRVPRVLVRVQPLPQPLPPLGVPGDVGQLARTRPGRAPRRARPAAPRAHGGAASANRVGSRRLTSPPDSSQASRSTSVTVVTSGGRPAAAGPR